MVYNPVSETILLYGGFNSTHVLSDTWEFDGSNGAWTLIDEATGLARSAFQMIYDTINDQIVTWGGFGQLRNATQVFYMSTKTWSILPHDDVPPIRNSENGLAYDQASPFSEFLIDG